LPSTEPAIGKRPATNTRHLRSSTLMLSFQQAARAEGHQVETSTGTANQKKIVD